MQITDPLTHHLTILAGDRDASQLAARLRRLGRDVTVAVPSCLSVSIWLVRLGSEITINTVAPASNPVAARASLAVPLLSAHPSNTLILRAGAPGAFLLLADDLDSQLGPDHHPIEVDKHRSAPAADESLTAVLGDFGAINQAIGVLIDQGMSPEAARRHLQHQADTEHTTIATTSRATLDYL